MHEISFAKTQDWLDVNNQSYAAPRYIDVSCPGCGRSLANVKLSWSGGSHLFCHTLIRCVQCGKWSGFFLLRPPKSKDPDAREKSQLYIYPGIGIEIKIDARIKDVSPKFQRIYRQALTAESMGLDEIAGMGHRKALEFLLRDYAKDTYSDKADSIDRTNSIGSVIHNFLAEEHPKLAIAAERAAWLGNDETHYRRDWQDKDLQDLKTLLALVISEVESQLLLRDLPEEMPHPREQKGQ